MYKILVVSPFYGGSLPISHYCTKAFEDIGCLVSFFDSTKYYATVSALEETQLSPQSYSQLLASYVQFVSDTILARIDSFQPDIVFALAQAPLSIATLERIRKRNILTAMWFVEDYERFPYWRVFAPHYDIFLTIQKEPFHSRLREIGHEHAHYLPLAALPSVHKEIAHEQIEKEFFADVSFIGAGYANRQQAFKQFTQFTNFKLWGNGWEQQAALAPYVQRNSQRVSTEESVKIFNASLINLNLHSHTEAKENSAVGDFVNPRTFEIAACNAFQIVDNRSLLHDFFSEEELVIANSWDDMKGKTEYYLKHPQKRKEIAQKAYERVIKEHSYQSRLRNFLDYVETHFPLVSERCAQRSKQVIAPELQKDLHTIMKSYNLANNASIEDIATAVQAKNAPLSETELALLFLYHWKKSHEK